MVRLPGLRAHVAAALFALIVGASSHALAEPSPRAVAMSRVLQIQSRRTLLEEQLVRLKTQLTAKRTGAAPLIARLESPALSLASAPQERGALLDHAAAALRGVSTAAAKVIGNMREDLALEHELSEIVAAAQRDLSASTADRSARGVAITKSKRLYLATLRERAKALSPAAAEARRVRVEVVIDRFRAQQEDASQLVRQLDAELRFASVSPALPPGEKGEAEAIKTCKMREIDWKNVTITVAAKRTTLRDGRGTAATRDGADEIAATLKQVDFADSNLDGREEALLLLERGNEDALYVIESALDCSLRRRADVTLAAKGGGTGAAEPGGYSYRDHEGRVHDLRWDRGRLVEIDLTQSADAR